MKKAFLLVPFLLLFATGTAHADLASLRLEGHLGASGGKGLGGGQKDNAFSEGATGGAYGGLVGIELLFVDVWVEHHQYVTPSKFLGTWTQFMAGFDLDLENFTHVTRAERKQGEKPKETSYMEIGLGIGYGVGTGQQVDPPLDAAQLTDQGFLVEGRFSWGLWVGGHAGLGLGITIPVSAGYFYKKNTGFVNDLNTQYYSAEAAVLLVVRGKIKLK